jgi:hypothetical protein
MQALVAAKGSRAWEQGYAEFSLVCRTDLSGIDAFNPGWNTTKVDMGPVEWRR